MLCVVSDVMLKVCVVSDVMLKVCVVSDVMLVNFDVYFL